jgi:hypothetical protein
VVSSFSQGFADDSLAMPESLAVREETRCDAAGPAVGARPG